MRTGLTPTGVREAYAKGLCPCCFAELVPGWYGHEAAPIAEGVLLCGFCIEGGCHHLPGCVEYILASLAGAEPAMPSR